MAIFKLQLMMSLVALIVNDIYCTVLEKLFFTTPFLRRECASWGLNLKTKYFFNIFF